MNNASFRQGEHYAKSTDLPSDEDPGYGYLYVIGKAETGPCKIGIAVNARRRIAALENANGMRFPCLWLSPLCANYKELEGLCHERLNQWRQIGEWFDVTFANLTDAIATNLEFDPCPGPDHAELAKWASNSLRPPSRGSNR